MAKVQAVRSFDDPRVQAFARLTNKQLRSEVYGSGLGTETSSVPLCIAETHFVVEAALDAGARPVAALIDEAKVERLGMLLDRLDAQGCTLYRMPVDAMSELVGFKVTRGCLCAFERPQSLELHTALERYQRFAVLENLTDVSNVGAIIRNARALEIECVIFAPGCADPFARRSIRTSMGHIFGMPWVQLRNQRSWADDLGRMKAAGVGLFALALTDDAFELGSNQAKSVLASFDKHALLFGSEGWGLSATALAASDARLIIPMACGVDSLNVAASTAITFFELRRLLEASAPQLLDW